MHILVPDIPLIEKVLRSVAVYAFLLVAFRLSGKRTVRDALLEEDGRLGVILRRLSTP